MPLGTGAHVFWGDTTPTLTSGTYTPTAPGLLVLIAISHTDTAPIGDATNVAGNGITNVTKIGVQGFGTVASPGTKVEIWAAITTSTAGTLTVTLPGASTGMLATLDEITGAFPRQGKMGLAQVVTGWVDGGASTAVSLNMNPFGSPQNGTFLAVSAGAATMTPKTGWTELDDKAYSVPNGALETQFIARADPTPGGTPSGGTSWGAVAVEIWGVPVTTPAYQGTLLQPSKPALLPTERLIRPIAALGTITGTLATTNANDTLAASGTTTIAGSLATTNANDTSAGSGVVGTTPTIAPRVLLQQQPSRTPLPIIPPRRPLVILGQVSGTLATTNANDTSAAAGTTTVTGTLAKTNANDTSAAAGTTTVTGALATTNANDTLSAAGTTKILGTLATTNANDTLAASGTAVGPPVVTTPAPTVGSGTLGRRGPYLSFDAELEKILADDDEIACLV